jgi:hypothetical protein
MKLLPLLLLPLICSSCTLIQLPARLINSALGPLVEADSPATPAPTSRVALKLDLPAQAPPTPTIDGRSPEPVRDQPSQVAVSVLAGKQPE